MNFEIGENPTAKMLTVWKILISFAPIWYCCRSEDADSFLHACIHHRNRNPILGKTLLYGYFKKCIPGTGCYEL